MLKFTKKFRLAFAALAITLSFSVIAPPVLAISTPPDVQDAQNAQNQTPASSDAQKQLSTNPIVKDINDIVNVLASAVALVIIANVIIGGIQYSAAGSSAESVNKAKSRIINAMIALATFLFVYAFLQWLVPGGLFNG